GQRLSVGVMEVARQLLQREDAACRQHHFLGLARGRYADRVGDVDFVAAEVAHAADHVGHGVQRHLSLVGAADGRADAAARAQPGGAGRSALAGWGTRGKRAAGAGTEPSMSPCETAPEAERTAPPASARAARPAPKPAVLGASAA